MARAFRLKRRLALPLLSLYGLGNILGAGIYVLIGKVAGAAGESTILAFLIAMLVAGLTAFSYMELAGRYPVSAGVSVYLHRAFGHKWLSLTVGLALVGGGITSAAALAKGFGGYLTSVVDVPVVVAAIGLLIVLGLVAAKGIGESAVAAAVFTAIEVIGLIIIIWLGRHLLGSFVPGQIWQLDPAVGVSGLLLGAFLAFYAFIGFEDLINVAEEVKRPQRTMPLAILISLLAATVLYMLVAVVATRAVGPAELSASSAPLTLVFDRLSHISPVTISLIGLAATTNGILVQIIMGSRILYGLASRGWLHEELAKLHAVNRTPLLATAIVVSLMIIGVVALPLVSLAQVTSFLILSIFSLVNASLVAIKIRHPRHAGFITVPLVVPILGTICCATMIGFELIRLW